MRSRAQPHPSFVLVACLLGACGENARPRARPEPPAHPEVPSLHEVTSALPDMLPPLAQVCFLAFDRDVRGHTEQRWSNAGFEQHGISAGYPVVVASTTTTSARLAKPIRASFMAFPKRVCEPAERVRMHRRRPGTEHASPALRAWAQSSGVSARPTNRNRLPEEVARELGMFASEIAENGALRWARVLTATVGEAPLVLVAVQSAREAAEPRSVLDDDFIPPEGYLAQPSSSLLFSVALLAHGDTGYGVTRVVAARMHAELPFELGASVQLDSDGIEDAVIVAPHLVGGVLHEGLIVGFTETRAPSLIDLGPRSAIMNREVACFTVVDGRPAYVMVGERVLAYVADASGDFTLAGSVVSERRAYSKETGEDVFMPVFRDSEHFGEGGIVREEAVVCGHGTGHIDLITSRNDRYVRYTRFRTQTVSGAVPLGQ